MRGKCTDDELRDGHLKAAPGGFVRSGREHPLDPKFTDSLITAVSDVWGVSAAMARYV